LQTVFAKICLYKYSMKICFATNNTNKIKEIQAIIGLQHELISLNQLNHTQELAETHFTIEENSLEKADFIYQKYKVPCFADDTGLMVDALNGAPGVFSARYAGLPSNSEKNIEKLLEALKNETNRKAHFKTVITLVNEKGEITTFEGRVDGTITTERGGFDGFGYDPIFVPIGYDKTFAEMTGEQKNSISHRAIATKKLIQHLNKQ
jgi:XTP/dITP diphosphohydrolase